MTNWTRTTERLPERGQLIEWISPGGIQTRGKCLCGLIWMPEGSDMYVYYTPAFWRPAS